MRLGKRRGIIPALPLILLALTVGSPSLAQSGPSAEPELSAEQEERLIQAKELFREGVAVYEANDVERALEYFRRSRAIYPSGKNSANAAICLEKLGRYDEALELYEEVVAKYLADVESSRDTITEALSTLRAKVGSLMVSSNVEASLVVDGRPRGKLPVRSALRLLPGTHLVRFIKDGYMTKEASIEITAEQTTNLDAPLIPLVASGGLRVEAVESPGAEVVIDGALVGISPWEGLLSPGTHVVQARTAQRGSRLFRTTVISGQTTLSRVQLAPLGPYVRVDVSPPSAHLSIDGVDVGRGKWQGVLPAGKHLVDATDEGYLPKQQSIDLDANVGPSRSVALVLEADRKHPRWPQPPTGHFWVAANAGWAIVPRTHSGAEQDCTDGCGWAMGGLVEARGGYEFVNHISVEVMTGYLSIGSRSTRHRDSSFLSSQGARPVAWELHDEWSLSGPLVGAGASMNVPLTGSLSLRARGTAGVMLGRVSNAVKGQASTGGDMSPADIQGAEKTAQATSLFVMPEVQIEKRLGNWRLGASLAALWIVQQGPELSFGKATVPPNCLSGEPTAAGCIGASQILSAERSYGPFVGVVPRIGAQFQF